MRIELPSPSWADAHRAQDDAHTLTLPEQRPLSLGQPQLLAGAWCDSQRTHVAAAQPRELTLTL
jgi:hypothetical protein